MFDILAEVTNLALLISQRKDCYRKFAVAYGDGGPSPWLDLGSLFGSERSWPYPSPSRVAFDPSALLGGLQSSTSGGGVLLAPGDCLPRVLRTPNARFPLFEGGHF